MEENSQGAGFVKAPQDLAAGLFLIALALFAFWLGSNLNPGTLRSMGPGMLPRIVSALVGITGVVLTVNAFLLNGSALDRIAFRGPLFVTIAIIVFGLTIRGFQIPLPGGGSLTAPALGILGAGPLAIMVSGFASPETKWGELFIFAIGMTVLCTAMFKLALNLPIPLSPIIFGY
ncbi:tripartite tricarboxylate transporter TctB family protein [Terrarubrum flagellatum]|uniref:tripartite tricarboxylate transporter TctB family protein n=1 Tax=Terrirubrum flagellatum TaxID=2895980 RepID=UPI003144FF67